MGALVSVTQGLFNNNNDHQVMGIVTNCLYVINLNHKTTKIQVQYSQLTAVQEFTQKVLSSNIVVFLTHNWSFWQLLILFLHLFDKPWIFFLMGYSATVLLSSFHPDHYSQNCRVWFILTADSWMMDHSLTGFSYFLLLVLGFWMYIMYKSSVDTHTWLVFILSGCRRRCEHMNLRVNTQPA